MGEKQPTDIEADEMTRLKLISEIPDENSIKQAIIAYLIYRGCLVLRVNSGAVTGQYEDKKGHIKERFMRFVHWQAPGVAYKEGKAGVSDILALYPDPNGGPCRFLAIETKRPGNTPTPAQERFLAEWQQRGGIALVAESVEDVEAALDQ
jgi:hypothetical protein